MRGTIALETNYFKLEAEVVSLPFFDEHLTISKEVQFDPSLGGRSKIKKEKEIKAAFYLEETHQ